MNAHPASHPGFLRRKLLLISAAGTLLTAAALQAETAWIGTNGNFHSGSNWDTGIAPAGEDIAVFDNRAGATDYWLAFGGEDATVKGVRVSPTSGFIDFTIGHGTRLQVDGLFQVGDGMGANPNARLLSGTLETGELIVHPGAFFRMRGETIPPGGEPNPPFLITNDGSTIASTDLLIGDFERAFDWTIAGGANSFTGTGPVSLADGVRSQATVRVQGEDTTWNTGNAQLNVGQRGVGQLVVADGAVINTAAAYLAREHAASAGSSALISGAGSRWNLSGTLRIGQTFAGNTLSILGGGEVAGLDARLGEAASASDNQVLISGPGSSWTLSSHLTLGGGGARNTLHLADGGRMDSAGFVRVGRDSTVNSTANSDGNKILIEDPGSRWTFIGTPPDASFSVGQRGSENELTIRNGGELLVTGSSYLALFPESSNNAATVTGPGSRWVNSAVIVLGREGSGNSLLIADGGAVETGSLFVSTQTAASNNHLEIAGGHLTVVEELNIGVEGEASLTFSGGSITAESLIATNGNNSAITFAGGHLQTAGATIANNVPLTIGNGDTCAFWLIGDGPHIVVDGVHLSTSGKLGGNGTLTASVVSDGQILPGSSVGTLTIDGSLVMEENSQLVLEVAGASGGQFDVLSVTGHAAINGWLSLLFLDGYSPAGGDSFQLLDFASSGGEFTMLDLPELPAGLDWNTGALYTAGELSIVGESTGENFEDWRAAWFSTEELADEEISGPDANPAGDGVTNLMRFALGLDPFEPGRAFLPSGAIATLTVNGVEGRYLTLTFTRPSGLSGIDYLVEGSAALANWSPTPVLVSQVENTDGTVTVTYRDSKSLDGAPRRFLRLAVELQQ